MLTASPLQTILLAVAIAAASIALVTDLRHRRIPNWLTGSSLLVGLLLNLGLNGPQGGVAALAGAGLGFVMLIPFYAVRGVGAGDVKLLAALGAILGPQLLLWVAAYGALVGGLMSLVIMAYRGTLMVTLQQVLVLRMVPTLSGAKAPYAVAIAAGVYLVVLLPIIGGAL